MKKLILLLFISIFLLTGCTTQSNDSISDNENKATITTTQGEDTKTNTTGIQNNLLNEDNKFSESSINEFPSCIDTKDIMYFIMVDRFCNGDTSTDSFDDVNPDDPLSYHGGDLKGVTEKLDYIKSLGVTSIWLSPVADNEPYGYHGYWIIDFDKVDEHLGDINDLKNLVKKAHELDMKVVLDYVVNHTGPNTPWLTDPDKADWFHENKAIDFGDQTSVENGWIHGLPDLNLENEEVFDYLMNNALWLIEETNVDGFRLDTVRHVPIDFWEKFTSKIKNKYPSFYFLGEVWSENQNYLEKYHQSGIDGLTNYAMYQGINDAFKPFGTTYKLVSAINSDKTFSNPNLNAIFIDNHDNKRHMSVCTSNQEEHLKQALAFLLTYPSVPVIYYGTEIAMEGGMDPDNRRDMEWEKTLSSKMLDYYKSLVQLRDNSKAIKSTNFKLISNDKYTMSYLRQSDEENVLLVFNLSNKEKEINITLDEPNNFYDYSTREEYDYQSEGILFKLNPFETKILINK